VVWLTGTQTAMSRSALFRSHWHTVRISAPTLLIRADLLSHISEILSVRFDFLTGTLSI
jgi:hypothetical protein